MTLILLASFHHFNSGLETAGNRDWEAKVSQDLAYNDSLYDSCSQSEERGKERHELIGLSQDAAASNSCGGFEFLVKNEFDILA